MMKPRALLIALICATPLGCASTKVALHEVARPEIVIDTLPRGALVVEGAIRHGSTPLVFRAASGTSMHRLELTRQGFHPQTLDVSGAEVAAHSGRRVAVPLRPDLWEPAAKPIDPDDAGQLLRVGADLSRAGRCPDALGFFGRAAQLNPRLVDSHKGLGICLARLGRATEALAAYKQYLLYAPSGPDADRIREVVSQAEGDIEVPPEGRQ